MMVKNKEKSNQNGAGGKEWRERNEPLLAVPEDERWVGEPSLSTLLVDKRSIKQKQIGL